MGVEIEPRILRGPWDAGFALHVHTLSSVFLGNNAYGHPEFHTTRSPVGELLYRLKYRNDGTAVEPLVESILAFWKTWHPSIDAIVPVPPSNIRKQQPVMLVASELSERLRVPICTECLSKIKKTPQLKDMVDYDKRIEALEGAFSVSKAHAMGKRLLLFDDLYGSGATVSAITEALKAGGAKSVCLLTLTTK
jgi:predicted amidophosphoribosyltransferase